MLTIERNEDKNNILINTRGISFEEINDCILSWNVVADFEHENKEKYTNQRKFIVICRWYAYIVPYVMSWDVVFLKTIIPSRKATKKYLWNL